VVDRGAMRGGLGGVVVVVRAEDGGAGIVRVNGGF
jgi:hypothetical protein